MSEQPNDGGPAFPSEQGHTPEGTWNQTIERGMSLRDYFAGQALAAMIGKSPFFDREGEHGRPTVDMWQFKLDMADSAYFYADAMLAARGAK